jgi:hypothetical protein
MTALLDANIVARRTLLGGLELATGARPAEMDDDQTSGGKHRPCGSMKPRKPELRAWAPRQAVWPCDPENGAQVHQIVSDGLWSSPDRKGINEAANSLAGDLGALQLGERIGLD